MKAVYILTIPTTALLLACFVHPQVVAQNKMEIRGIYGNPEPLWKKNMRLDSLNVNAIFVHHGSINQEMVRRARAEGAKVFAEFASLNGKNYVDQHPEAWAINERGERVQPATWFMGVCPTEPGFKAYRMAELTKLLRMFHLDGVWMDYVHWHAQFEDPEPILPETCFCENCLAQFQAASGITLPQGNTAQKAQLILTQHDTAWRNWRCSVIADWVRAFRAVMDREKPGTLLGVYHCPWDDDDFDGARRRVLGLDYDTLKGLVDIFSPMVYHERMGRDPDWVKENITWFCNRIGVKEGTFPKVWPIVQAHNDPGVVSADDFEKVLRYGVSAGASGVMMFTTHAVAEDEAKTEVMRKVFEAWKGR